MDSSFILVVGIFLLWFVKLIFFFVVCILQFVFIALNSFGLGSYTTFMFSLCLSTHSDSAISGVTQNI